MIQRTEAAPHLEDQARLRSLAETGLLDAPERASLHRYVRIAAGALDAAVSLVSLVDDERQFFAAAHGLDRPWKERRGTPLSHSFCQHVVNERSELVVEDARNDDRLCDNLAIEDLNVVAYAGVPLCDSDSLVLGSFCVIDDKPRRWTHTDLALLRLLAGAVADEIELARRTWLAEKAEADLADINQEITAAHQRTTQHNASVMHDLRSPLQVVLTGVASIAEHPSIQVSETLTRTVAMLQRNVRQAVDLVQTNANRRGDDDLFQSVDASGVVADVCRDLATGQSVEVDYELTPSRVLADPTMIRRAVQNLFTNALRFASNWIGVRVACNEGMVRIVVEDDGSGLPEDEDYERIWELGQRFHRTRSNTGIGLAVTRQLVQALGGRVNAGPSSRGGARFELWLPESRQPT